MIEKNKSAYRHFLKNYKKGHCYLMLQSLVSICFFSDFSDFLIFIVRAGY